MKKVYSKRAGREVFALAPEQLDIFAQSGYKTPSPEDVIADAGAAVIEPPEGKRAYVVFNYQKGEFCVRVRSCTLKGNEAPAFVGEVVQASVTKRLAENADPDRTKAATPPSTAPLKGTLGEILSASIKKAMQDATQKTEGHVDAAEEVSL